MTLGETKNSTQRRRSIKKPAIAIIGLILGGVFFWLALRQVDLESIELIIHQLVLTDLLAAILVYWIGIWLRTLRWHRMLGPSLGGSINQIGETLIVGYAVNYLLPARMGELFRADYAHRRFGIPRSAALGSIAIERLLDGVVVVGFLWGGFLWAVQVLGSQAARDLWAMAVVAEVGTIVFGIMGICVFALLHYRQKLKWGPTWLQVRIAAFVDGLATLKAAWSWRVVILSFAIWVVEALALWLVFRAFGFALAPGMAAMLVGAATLSTLVPTAPGFVGSHQLVFVVAMKALAASASLGLVAATAIQIFFFGSVTLVGIGLFFARQLSVFSRPAAASDTQDPLAKQ